MNSKRYPVDLFSFCDVAGLVFCLTYVPFLDEPWQATFKDSMNKNDGTLLFGSGISIERAINNYIDQVQGKILIISPDQPNARREVFVPSLLTIEDRE